MPRTDRVRATSCTQALRFEPLEERWMLNATAVAHHAVVHAGHAHVSHLAHGVHPLAHHASHRLELAPASLVLLAKVRAEFSVSTHRGVPVRYTHSAGLPLLAVGLNPSDIRAAIPSKNSVAGNAVPAPPAGALTPAQVETAYGISQLPGQGQGMTIAIVDPYNDPNITADLATFSTAFGLPQVDGLNGNPTFRIDQPQGVTPNPPSGTGSNVETALDVEWVHAAAPKANILLVESKNFVFDDGSGGGVLPALDYAWSQSVAGAPVVAISNSYGVGYTGGVAGSGEFSSQTQFDFYFQPPAGTNVVITFSTGDNGQPGSWPAYSSNVVAVGGTGLYPLTAGGRYGRELAWTGGGGGTSQYTPKPGYQTGAFFDGLTNRSIPDVSLVADSPNTPVAVYDTYDGGWFAIGGTSVSAPIFAGITALADQARASNGFAPLTTTGMLTKLYAAYNTSSYPVYFHDVTAGSNGFAAGTGYDLATGLGSPKVQTLIPYLALTA